MQIFKTLGYLFVFPKNNIVYGERGLENTDVDRGWAHSAWTKCLRSSSYLLIYLKMSCLKAPHKALMKCVMPTKDQYVHQSSVRHS